MRFLFAAFIFAAMCASGQTSGSFTASSDSVSRVMTFGAAPPSSRGVTGAPYSADQISENVQTLGDGTHITRKDPTVKFFRDSMGRTRTERSLTRSLGNPVEPPLLIEIVDPVALVKYTLDTVNHVAHRQHMAQALDPRARMAARQSATAAPARAAIPEELRPQFTNEKLGVQNIEGIPAEGTRFTTTFPIGSQGNDRPMSTVNENWQSRQLGVIVMTKSSDPRFGENIRKLTNISLSEPPANLFLAPPEYSIVDEAGEFKIQWSSQK